MWPSHGDFIHPVHHCQVPTVTRQQALEGGTTGGERQRRKKAVHTHLTSIYSKIISERSRELPISLRKGNEVTVGRGERKGTIWSCFRKERQGIDCRLSNSYDLTLVL